MLVPRGSVYGFLGPNGSGKTTTIRMLLGLVYPTQGSHELLGVPMPAGTVQVLPRVGSLVEGPAFYPQLSGRDNLARVDAADRTADPGTAKARISEALERVGLLAAKKKHYRAYSLGMKQRLAIAASLLQAAGADHPGRADQRARPAGHPRGARADPGDRHRRHHRPGLLASPRRGRADLHPGRRHADRAAGLPGTAGGAAGPRRGPDPGHHDGRHPGRRGPRQAGAGRRRRPPTGRRPRRSAIRRRSRSAASWSTRRPGRRPGHAAARAWRNCSSDSPGRDSMSTAELSAPREDVPAGSGPAWPPTPGRATAC